MPDWSYQTVFRSTLFRLGPRRGRDLALGAMGRLARWPLGKNVIRLMGHMQPDVRIALNKGSLHFASRVGLGCSLDPNLVALSALAEFGFGHLEIGPIAIAPLATPGEIFVDPLQETIRFRHPLSALDATAASRKLKLAVPLSVPVFVRVMAESTDDVALIVETLGPGVAGFIVPLRHLDAFHTAVAKSEGAERRPILLVLVNADGWREEANRERIVSALREQRAAGVVIDAVTCDRGECVLGTPALSASIETIRTVRDHIGPDALLIGGVGVHSPADALDVLDAGADLVRVDSGLGFAGPGLPKRINEAILYRELARQVADRTPPTRMASQSWFWAFLMGLSMFLGGLLSLFVATTRVLLPYDEALCGLTRDQVASINDRLLAFMTHDRVTLWGTMLADGILYMALAWWGIRRGLHWAQLAVIVSAFTGFISFFWFLGFGYFDPFHAFVTAILFQFLIMTLHADLPARRAMESPDLWNDGRFKANQWGQLAFVIHGAVLIVAGIVISVVGMTSVFVHEDLEFMRTTADALVSAHPGLLPLVAHDRATFGGMLLSCGAVTLLSALWGFCHGQRWLWWALMIAGTIAYGATLAVHHHVGYDSLLHLAPAYGGLTLLWIGGAASYRYLVASDPRLTPEWRRRLAATL